MKGNKRLGIGVKKKNVTSIKNSTMFLPYKEYIYIKMPYDLTKLYY